MMPGMASKRNPKKPGKKQPKIEIEKGDLDYGIVTVVAGRLKGKIGYYDDDDEDQMGIVYFGKPFAGGYYVIQRRHLRPATWREQKRYLARFKLTAREKAIFEGMGVAIGERPEN